MALNNVQLILMFDAQAQSHLSKEEQLHRDNLLNTLNVNWKFEPGYGITNTADKLLSESGRVEGSERLGKALTRLQHIINKDILELPKKDLVKYQTLVKLILSGTQTQFGTETQYGVGWDFRGAGKEIMAVCKMTGEYSDKENILTVKMQVGLMTMSEYDKHVVDTMNSGNKN